MRTSVAACTGDTPGPQASDTVERALEDDSAVDRFRFRLDDEGRPEFSPLGWELEAVGEDPDDDVGLVVKL